MRLMEALETIHSSRVVQLVETVIGFTHQRVAVQGIGVHRAGPSHAGGRQQQKRRRPPTNRAKSHLQTRLLSELAIGLQKENPTYLTLFNFRRRLTSG